MNEMSMHGLKRFSVLTTAAAAVTLLLITFGGAVAFTGSTKAIPDWPTSFGKLTPPAEGGALIEYVHRVLAAAAGVLILTTAVFGLRDFRKDLRLSLPPVLAAFFIVPAAILGARAVLASLTPALAVIDLGCALTVLALTVAAAVSARIRVKEPVALPSLQGISALSILSFGSCVFVFAALALAVATAPAGTPPTCLGWPAWGQAASLIGDGHALAVIQYLASAAATIFIIASLAHAWRARRSGRTVLTVATLAAVLFFTGIVNSELAAALHYPLPLMGIRVVLASGTWAALAALLMLSFSQSAYANSQPG
jgi:heme A synthase